MIDFIKKHEKLLQRDDPGKAALASLKKRLEELHVMIPDYQSIADEICARLEEEEWLTDNALNVGDRVVGIGRSVDGRYHGLRGKIVEIRTYRPEYGVEWEREIQDGHDCEGNAKDGQGYYVYPDNLTKENQPPKTEINSKKEYDKYVSDLVDFIVNQEYLDFDDKYFSQGDEVEIIAGDFGGLSVGDRVSLGAKCQAAYHVCGRGTKYHIPPQAMAKVKKRKNDFNVGDAVEVIDAPSYYITKSGSKGIISEFNKGEALVKFPFLTDEDQATAKKPKRLIHLRFLRVIESKDERKLKGIINEIETEFAFPEYEDKRLELKNEISELLEKEIISVDGMKEYLALDVLTDLELDDPDDELEELLK